MYIKVLEYVCMLYAIDYLRGNKWIRYEDIWKRCFEDEKSV